MKPTYKDFIIAILLFMLGAVSGGWIVYAIMKEKTTVEVTQNKRNEIKAQLDTADNATRHRIVDSLFTR